MSPSIAMLVGRPHGFSELILELFGPEIGRHSRSAVGVAGLPLGFAVEIEAEVLLDV